MKLLSYYLADSLLDHLFAGISFQPPLVMGVALSKGDPSPSGTGLDEPLEGDNYARVATYASWWTHDGITSLYNSTTIVFPEATGDWGSITHFALFDSASYGTGNMLFYAELLGAPQVVVEGCIPRFEIAALIANMS